MPIPGTVLQKSSMAAILATLLVPLSGHASPSFTGLGDLPGGEFYSVATAVSADGSTVVGYSGVPNTDVFVVESDEAFRWTRETSMVGLGPGSESGGNSRAIDVSADGSFVVGWGATPGNGRASRVIRWAEDGEPDDLASLPGGSSLGCGMVPCEPAGISADGGTIVGVHEVGSPFLFQGFRYDETGGLVSLGSSAPPPSPARSVAEDVSADGDVVVGASLLTGLRSEAFRWTEQGGIEDLGFLSLDGSSTGESFSAAMAISGDASTIIGISGVQEPFGAVADSRAFRWTRADGMVEMPPSTTPRFVGAALTHDGSVVVGSDGRMRVPTDDRGAVALIWDEEHGTRRLDEVLLGYGLDFSGWALEEATGISADGRVIVGNGMNPDGELEAWVAVLPEPGTGLLLGCGLAALAAKRRRNPARSRERPDARP